ncbi:MAG: hypothetical protein MJY78_10015 [Fibrobacter sp.]|nr:hypothetical protein [Fibrobacter sp.]
MKNKLFTLCFFIALLCAVFAGADEVSTSEVTAAENSAAPEASTAVPEASAASTTVDTAATTDTAAIDSTPYGLPKELLPLWDSLTIKQKAAQMVMVYFSPAKFLIENEFGAVLVMKNHLKDVDSFKEKLQAANDGLRIPLLVATDQEGGRVNRLGNISEQWKDAPSAKEMREMPGDSIAEIAKSIGAELHALGINLNLAPVLDPAKDHRGKNSFIEESKRSWDKDSTSVEKVRAFVKGMRESGVSCVSKHFPGYDSWTNSDHQIAISSSPKKKMTENYHFFLNLAEDIPVTMMSSVRFVRVSSRPAVFEPKIVRMARKMSPDMVILTDDLWGVSLRAWISGTERVTSKNYPRRDFRKLILTALNAGNDMFMITYPAKAVEMVKYLEQLAKNEKYKTRIEESAARILKLKYKAGLLQ